MATVINAGRVAMVVKGAWSSSTTYSKLDVVSYDGSSYVSIADSNTNQTPSSATTYWQLLAQGYANLKTVNSNSLLGSGDVTIDGITSITTSQDGTVVITVASGGTYTINLNHVHNKSVTSTSDATVTLDAHIIYDLGTVAGNKTINLPSTVDAGAEYEFRLAYTSGTIGGTAISGTTVANDATLTFTAGKTYQVIICGGILYFSETTTPS